MARISAFQADDPGSSPGSRKLYKGAIYFIYKTICNKIGVEEEGR